MTGSGRQAAKEAIGQVLGRHFRVGREVLLVDAEDGFFIKNSRLPILLITHFGEHQPEREFFSGEAEQVAGVTKLAEILPNRAHLILNFDDETVREIKNKSKAHVLTFGFGARADMRVSDVSGTNFKINFEGNIVPVWLEGLSGKEHIYAALAAAAVGEALGLNLVEISEALRYYKAKN